MKTGFLNIRQTKFLINRSNFKNKLIFFQKHFNTNASMQWTSSLLLVCFLSKNTHSNLLSWSRGPPLQKNSFCYFNIQLKIRISKFAKLLSILFILERFDNSSKTLTVMHKWKQNKYFIIPPHQIQLHIQQLILE